jgi:hypothetical protein
MDNQREVSYTGQIENRGRNVTFGFIHLRLRTGHDVEKKKSLRGASLEDRYRQEMLCTHMQGSRRTELDEDIALDLGLLSVRMLRVASG